MVIIKSFTWKMVKVCPSISLKYITFIENVDFKSDSIGFKVNVHKVLKIIFDNEFHIHTKWS